MNIIMVFYKHFLKGMIAVNAPTYLHPLTTNLQFPRKMGQFNSISIYQVHLTSAVRNIPLTKAICIISD